MTSCSAAAANSRRASSSCEGGKAADVSCQRFACRPIRATGRQASGIDRRANSGGAFSLASVNSSLSAKGIVALGAVAAAPLAADASNVNRSGCPDPVPTLMANGFSEDGRMPLFCPTRQRAFRGFQKPLRQQDLATVHGVVFRDFVLGGLSCCEGAAGDVKVFPASNVLTMRISRFDLGRPARFGVEPLPRCRVVLP